MALAERLSPTHRQPMALPRPWPGCAQGLLRRGASWLHGEGWGGDLLGLPAGPRLESRWNGHDWITTLDGRPEKGRPFDLLEQAAEAGHPWIGALSYELACWEAGLPHQVPSLGALGQAWQGLSHALHVDGGTAEIWRWGDPPVADIQGFLAEAEVPARPQLGALKPRWSQSTHREAVETIRARILDGGFYVANLCVPFDAAWTGDRAALALSCFQRAEPPRGAFLPLGQDGLALLCLSMERVLGKSGSTLVSEPIKGSVSRTGDAAADEAAGRSLLTDPKEQAEHTMIVDLVRNDLGRVAEAGSVRVPELMALRAYPTVQHLVSRVEAEARPNAGLAEILRAMLPGGSVTGAPKHAVCTHIAGVEAAPRGFYCGALGWIRGGEFDLALPIRTAQLVDDHLIYWAGGGITLRSDAAKEWRELHLKTQVMRQP
ncbi:MAG: anthranilate synthase component I family protein [Holophagaceae bacterium]|nr:anthranilate synthase component I family protein [Holophagaceae bacterium]